VEDVDISRTPHCQLQAWPTSHAGTVVLVPERECFKNGVERHYFLVGIVKKTIKQEQYYN